MILNNMRSTLILYSLRSIWYNFDIFEQCPIIIILSINKNYCIQTSQYVYTMIHVEQLQEIDMKLAKKKLQYLRILMFYINLPNFIKYIIDIYM